MFVANGFWEEHCIECGAPACYGTCKKFRRAPGGMCRRFAHGIKFTKNGFSIEFLAWGKLELYWQGRMLSETAAKIIQTSYRLLAPLVRILTSEYVVRGLCRRIGRWVGSKTIKPGEWRIKCNATVSNELIAEVVNSKNEELLVRRLAIKPGSNEFRIDLPDLSPGTNFRISSLDGTHGPIEFTSLEIVPKTSAKHVKCLAWDLDNTLWKGILAEDGADGVELRPEAVALIKKLDQRGILNTICSKNDWAPVQALLEKFALLDYFVFPEVNWEPKSSNLKRAAKNINIGIDTFAFIDDSPHERGEVAVHLPMVRVYTENELDRIAEEDCFNPPISKESAVRRLSYLAEMRRHKAEITSGVSRLDFLKECEIELTCGALASQALVERCWELVNRTNQLTLAAHRYTEAEFSKLISNPEIATYAVHCKDKYGDYGIVGFIAIGRVQGGASVQEFVMSCRVAKKLCEQSVLLFMADRLKAEGVAHLSATVVRTGRNNALIEAFDAMPFEKQDYGGEKTVYRLELNAQTFEDVFRNAVKIGKVTA